MLVTKPNTLNHENPDLCSAGVVSVIKKITVGNVRTDLIIAATIIQYVF
jgi:hypothetical protein